MKKIVIICGPTGIGKTSVAIELAEAFNGEIISADSIQIYRYMNIGAAKPTPEERARVQHHLIDIVNPDDPFDAARFAAIARETIDQLHAEEILPFVAGGTGFYIKTLTHGICDIQSTNSDIRAQLKQEAAENGVDALYARLCQSDPDTAKNIHPNDAYRIIRALEVYETTGKPISEYRHAHQFAESPFNILKIGLHMNRELLYERINQRVDAMIATGLLYEVRRLLDMGYTPELKAMQSIGYRHMADFIYGRLSWDEAIRRLKRDTRRYAKRQLTWFKADPEIVWIEPGQQNQIHDLIRNFINSGVRK